jgi:Planctomycete cytochrome C
MKISTKLIPALLAAGLGLAVTVMADDDTDGNTNSLPPASTRPNVTYATDIKPIFDNSCVKCHSGDRPKAHLKLDTLAGALKGSRDGPVIIPGDSAKSQMILAVSHATEDHHEWMPPLHNRAGIGPLTPEQIGLIRAWIDQGAK